jgi:hypothetical protein
LTDFPGDVSRLPALSGSAGTLFGSSLAIRSTQLAIGAPAEMGGAVYTSPADGSGAPARAQTGSGGFGSSVAWAQLAGGGPSLVVGAPGRNAVLIAAPGAAPLEVRGAASVSGLGASLALFSLGDSDAIVSGAPSLSATPGAGAVYAVRASNFASSAPLQLGDNGTPAALSATGMHSGDSAGSQVAAADFNGDGFPDLAVAAQKSIFIYKGPLP